MEPESVVSVSVALTNAFPFLFGGRRRVHNAPSFRACSQLVSSLSGYQHTRKAWRRDALELLLEPAFFQMDLPCLAHWRATVDHLMTNDKTTFRDFMGACMSLKCRPCIVGLNSDSKTNN